MDNKKRLADNVFRRLDELLHRHGWTYNRLSVESGVSLNALYQMRKRRTLPTLPTLYDICCAFDITLAEFFIFDSTNDENITKFIQCLNKLSPDAVACLYSLTKFIK